MKTASRQISPLLRRPVECEREVSTDVFFCAAVPPAKAARCVDDLGPPIMGVDACVLDHSIDSNLLVERRSLHTGLQMVPSPSWNCTNNVPL